MIKRILYSLVTMICAIFLIFGSMFMSNRFLLRREAKLLSETGKMKVESLVVAWNTDKEEQTEKEEAAGAQSESGAILDRQGEYAVKLSEEEMIRALKNLDSGMEELIHEPVEGQLSMEEAINTGINWVKAMMHSEDKFEEALYLEDVKAALSFVMGNEKVKETAPYYSFWKVELSYGLMVINLSINAVDGRVWRADINIYGEISDYIYMLANEKIYQFSHLAGMNLSYASNMEADGNSVSLNFTNSSIYTEMRGLTEIIGYRDITDAEESGTDSAQSIDIEIDEKEMEYISIRYTLKIKE